MTSSNMILAQCCCTCCRARMCWLPLQAHLAACHTREAFIAAACHAPLPLNHDLQNPDHGHQPSSVPTPPLLAGEASPSSGGYLTSNFLLNCINWLVVLFIVLLLAAFTVWGAFSFALDKGAAASYNFASQAQSTIKEGVALAQQFLTFYDGFAGNLKATLQSNPAGAQLGRRRWLLGQHPM